VPDIDFGDYDPAEYDDRVTAYANAADEGVCPDGCGYAIEPGSLIVHHNDLGVWVLADHPVHAYDAHQQIGDADWPAFVGDLGDRDEYLESEIAEWLAGDPQEVV
jgi:hypothetical protein